MRIRNLFENKIDYYQSIDELPIYNWHKINQTNELEWLLRKKVLISDHQKKILSNILDRMLSEFIDTFGIPEKMREILDLKSEIFILRCQMALENNKFLQNFIDIAEWKLKQIIADDQTQSTTQVKVYVEKYLGFRLNERETTVKEFYEYIEAIKNQNKNIAHGRQD